MELADQIAALNPQPNERFSANYILGSADMVSVVLTPDMIPGYVESLPPTADIWIGVNPVDPTNIPPGKRGKASDVTRLTSLYADLDVKEGGCPTYEVAFAIVSDLAALLGEEPTFVVYSGHGIQPYWIIDPDENRPNAELAVLLRRWGQLVKLVAKRRNAQADSVFDLSRILRAVMTLNNKYDDIVDVLGEMRTGGPMTLRQVDERLYEAGIYPPEVADLELDDTPVPVAGWSQTECRYCTQAFTAWSTETPGERHPRLINWFTRLECMRLLGCLTYGQYQAGAKIAADRFTQLCERGIGGKPRAVKPFEIEDCLDWGAVKAAAKGAAELAAEVGKHQHDLLGGIVNPNAPQVISAPFTAQSGDEAERTPDLFRRIFDAEADFWSATASLKMIYDTSMARMVSPWAVLAYCAARMLYLIPPSVELPGLIGTRGSLNWFAVVVDASGGGKSAAASVAEELVVPRFPIEIKEKNPGSGEGIIGQFYDAPVPPAKNRTRRDAVMFTTDEIDTLTAMSQRQGGTTLSTIRTAFSGGTLGFSYITKGRDEHVQKNTYRMTFIINAQPSRCGSLLADHGGGTPQRFMWFPANDLRPTAEGCDEDFVPAGIPIPGGLALLGRKRIQIPAEARDLILATREGQLRGQQDALDGHRLFCREKFAYALALLDGRTDMGEEDWRLSGIADEVSTRTREWTQAELAKSMEVEAKEVGKQRGITFAAADNEKAHQQAQTVRTVQDWVLKRLKDKGIQKTRELTQACASRSRPWLKNALDALIADGLVVHDLAETTWDLP